MIATIMRTRLNDNPPGPDSGDYRTFRGGSWNFDELDVRCAYRNAALPTIVTTMWGSG